MKTAKKDITNPILASWISLNDAMREANEETCKSLLREELKGRNRKRFVLRIHSRINKIRADRERKELMGRRV